MRVLIAYDIPSNSKRSKMSKALMAEGERVQRSLFEIDASEADLRAIRRKLLRRFDLSEDNLRIYRLCRQCQDRVETHGSAIIPTWEEDNIL